MRESEVQGKGNQLLLWQSYNKYTLNPPRVCYLLQAASLRCYTSVTTSVHVVCLVGLWPPLPVLPRSLLPSFLGGLCCSLVIAFCNVCPYPRATSNLLCSTMVFQSIYNILFSFIYRYLSHYCNVKGFEFGSVQVTSISSFTGIYSVNCGFMVQLVKPYTPWPALTGYWYVPADWTMYFEW